MQALLKLRTKKKEKERGSMGEGPQSFNEQVSYYRLQNVLSPFCEQDLNFLANLAEY